MKDKGLISVYMYKDELEDYIKYLVFQYAEKTECNPEGFISNREAWLFFRMYQRYIEDLFFEDAELSIFKVIHTDIMDNCICVSPKTIGKGLFSELEKAYYAENTSDYVLQIPVQLSEDLQEKLRNTLEFDCDFIIEAFDKEWQLMLLRKE